MLNGNLPGHVGSRGWARRGLMAGAAASLLVATLALSACGATAQTSHGTTGGSANAGGATSTTSVGSIPGGGMAVRPCPGLVSDATQVGALALTLTPNHPSGSMQVGELAQVRLPAALHWTLTSKPTQLTSVGQAGGQDTTLNVCYWTFRAASTGTITLAYAGAQPCDPPEIACSNAITEQKFIITVS